MRKYYRNLKRRRSTQYRINKVFYRKLVENHPNLTVPEFSDIVVTPVNQIYEMIEDMMLVRQLDALMSQEKQILSSVVMRERARAAHWQSEA